MDLGWDIDPTVFDSDIPDWLEDLNDPWADVFPLGSLEGGGEGEGSDMPAWFEWFVPGSTEPGGDPSDGDAMVTLFGVPITDSNGDGDNFDEVALAAGAAAIAAGNTPTGASFALIALWAAYADANM